MIYADYNSTTPLARSVAERMTPFLSEEFGDPVNLHTQMGRRACEAIEVARAEVAKLVHAAPEEVVFTSGGTESSFHALTGALKANSPKNHLITSAVEHSAVLQTLRFLEEFADARCTQLRNEAANVISSDSVYSALRMNTAVLTFTLADHETGTILPLSEAVKVGRPRGITVHTDAAQAVGKIAVDFERLGVDLMSVSAHKFGGPKGVGALVVRHGCSWEPLFHDSAYENGRRGGMPAIALIVGMGEAARLRKIALEQGLSGTLTAVRDHFEKLLLARVENGRINQFGLERLPNTSSVTIPGVSAANLANVLAAKDCVIASGAVWNQGNYEPSRLLRQFGLRVGEAMSTIRVSFGAESTLEEAQILADLIAEQVVLELENKQL